MFRKYSVFSLFLFLFLSIVLKSTGVTKIFFSLDDLKFQLETKSNVLREPPKHFKFETFFLLQNVMTYYTNKIYTS